MAWAQQACQLSEKDFKECLSEAAACSGKHTLSGRLPPFLHRRQPRAREQAALLCRAAGLRKAVSAPMGCRIDQATLHRRAGEELERLLALSAADATKETRPGKMRSMRWGPIERLAARATFPLWGATRIHKRVYYNH